MPTFQPHLAPQKPKKDALLEAFILLCHQLDHPVVEAEARSLAAAGPRDETPDARLKRLTARFGLTQFRGRLSKRKLAAQATPFLVLGSDPGHAWLARGRTGDRLVLVDSETGAATAYTAATVADMASTIVELKPSLAQADDIEPGLWRDAIAKRLKPVFWEIGVASVFINLLALATPLFMMTVYNKVINHNAISTLNVLAIGMISLFAFELILRAMRGYIVSHTGAKLDASIGSEVVHHLLNLPYRVFENMPSGQMLERLRQLDHLRQFLTGNLPLLIVDLAFVGLFVAAIFFVNTTLGLVTAAVMPAFLLLSVLSYRRQQSLVRDNFRATAAKSSGLAETISQAMTVKSLGLESEMEERFQERQLASAWSGYRANRLANFVGAAGQSLQHVAGLAIVFIGARMIMAGELSIGALVAITILSARAIAPMRQIFFAWHQFQQARDAFKRLDSLMREKREGQGAEGLKTKDLKGNIQLQSVTFSYPGQEKPAVDDLSLEIKSGSMFALAGPPGSGKSTFLKLLLGLERPQQGQIVIDGLDIAQMSPKMLRQTVGVVPQDIQLFAGSIADNIGLGAADRSRERVIAAAKFAGADEFIRSLADGYDTNLGERGQGLSTGQKQQLCIARAIIRNPRLLILDEATSALDAASETYLMNNLKRASKGRTIILITHRMSVIQRCDRVAVFRRGSLIRLCTPPELAERPERRFNRANLQAVT